MDSRTPPGELEKYKVISIQEPMLPALSLPVFTTKLNLDEHLNTSLTVFLESTPSHELLK